MCRRGPGAWGGGHVEEGGVLDVEAARVAAGDVCTELPAAPALGLVQTEGSEVPGTQARVGWSG